MSSPPSPSGRPTRLSSPLSSQPANRSYEQQLESHLSSPTQSTTANGQSTTDSDDDQDESEYTGLDSGQHEPEPLPGEPHSSPNSQSPAYKDQLASFLESDDEVDASRATGIKAAGQSNGVDELARPVSRSLTPHITQSPTWQSAVAVRQLIQIIILD